MIRPNCRIQFTPEDIEFITSVLCFDDDDGSDSLTELLSDSECFDIILDDKKLIQAILERPGYLEISPHLYFYILVRHVLKNTGIDDRIVADYIAAVLTEYSRAERLKAKVGTQRLSMDNLIDILNAVEVADSRLRFFLQMFVGNYMLFLTGIFPDHLHHRTQYHAAPGIDYYEKLGKSNYRFAGKHQLAMKYELSDVLLHLSDSFRKVRLALNDLSNRLIFLDEPGYG
jgi:hypothetical protein